MKTWLIRINLLVLLSLIFITSCSNEKKIVFQGTSDELMELEKKDLLSDYDKNSIIEVEGKVAWISYPKDGFNLNRCTVYLATNGCDEKKLRGNFVCCEFNERIDKENVGKEMCIRGLYQRLDGDSMYHYVFMIRCEVIQNFSILK